MFQLSFFSAFVELYLCSHYFVISDFCQMIHMLFHDSR